MPNFGAMLPTDQTKENQNTNGPQMLSTSASGPLFPMKNNQNNVANPAFLPMGSSIGSRSGLSSSFRDQAGAVASPLPPRSAEFPRNPLLAKTPTLGDGHVTPRKVSFGSVMTQSNSKMQGCLAHEAVGNLSFAPEASPLGLSRSSYNILSSAEPQNSTLSPMSVENGNQESMATRAHSPAVTFFGVDEDVLSHSTSFAPTPAKSLLNCSAHSHLQSQDPWAILRHEISDLAHWKNPLASLAAFTVCSTMLLLTSVAGFSLVSVVSGYFLGTCLVGSVVCSLHKSAGLSLPALQAVALLPLCQLDAWETAVLAATACAFRLVELAFAFLRAALSGADPKQTCALLAALWLALVVGPVVHAGPALALLLLCVFVAPPAWQRLLRPRALAAVDFLHRLSAPVQTALLAAAACLVTAATFALLRTVLLALSGPDWLALAAAAAAALLIAAHAEGKSPGRVLAAAVVSGGRAMGPSALQVLRAIQSPLKDGQRKR